MLTKLLDYTVHVFTNIYMDAARTHIYLHTHTYPVYIHILINTHVNMHTLLNIIYMHALTHKHTVALTPSN